MTDTWAAKVLEGVRRYRVVVRNGTLSLPTGNWPDHELTPVITEADALAAIAKLGAGDGLVERLNRADEYEPLGHDGWEAADRIAALKAQLAEKDEQLVSVLRRETATYERHDAKMEAAEARAEALLKRAAQMAYEVWDDPEALSKAILALITEKQP